MTLLQTLYREDLYRYLEEVRCNLCGADDSETWAVVNNFTIVRCRHCSLVYVNPRVNQEGLKEIYSEEFFEIQSDDEDSRKREEMYRIEIRDLESIIDRGSILDVGTGGGFFLKALSNNWDKYGCEISERAASFGREKFGLNIETGALRDIGYEDNFFDVVNFRGVIEHVPDPYADLKEAYRILKDGGIVSINTPNIDGLCGRLYRGRFRLVDPITHIYYFSTKTISRMLEKAGFEIVKASFFYMGTPYENFLRDVAKIILDMIILTFYRRYRTLSPPFFRSVINIYGRK
jgi:SAM-dependent methyltransferase